MVSFTIRKYSKLLNPTTNEATWLHRPERSELLFSFEDIDTNTAVLKVIWRLTVFEKVVFARGGTSDGHPTISVSHKYPYVSIKVMTDCNNVQSRFQVGFFDQTEYERCLQYLRAELEIDSRLINAPLISSRELNNEVRQVSASQHIDAQPFANPGLLTHDFTQFSQQNISQGTQVQLLDLSQPASQFAWPETVDFPDTQYDDTCLSLLEPELTNNTTTDPGVDASDISALLDEPTNSFKQKILARLQDPDFERFVNRVDEIVQQESSIKRRKLCRK